jgi:hypothetical protein
MSAISPVVDAPAPPKPLSEEAQKWEYLVVPLQEAKG